jgi:hypothetical protein
MACVLLAHLVVPLSQRVGRSSDEQNCNTGRNLGSCRPIGRDVAVSFLSGSGQSLDGECVEPCDAVGLGPKCHLASAGR